MEDTACESCGQPCLVIKRGQKHLRLCSNEKCPTYHPDQIVALAKAALHLRAKTIGFGEFKRIVDTNTTDTTS